MALLVCFRNRHQDYSVSDNIPLLITNHKLGKNVSLIVLDTNFTKNFACGTDFQFDNHDLFGEVSWN